MPKVQLTRFRRLQIFRRHYDAPRYLDPLHSSRNPFQTFMLTVSLVAAIPLLFGETASGTISSNLPPLVVDAWGACLLFGCTIALTGGYWRGRPDLGLRLEWAGLILVGAAASVYALVIYGAVGLGARYPMGVQAAYGAACLWRVRQISRRFAWERRDHE